MSDQFPPLLVSLMWNLLFTGDEPMVSKAKPGVKKKTLEPLLDAGLIVLEKRGRASHIVLTDRAWQWSEENLHAEFSKRANMTPALEGLLLKLQAYLKQTGTPLAEVICVEGSAEPEPAEAPRIPEPQAETRAPSADFADPVAQQQPLQPSIDEAIRQAYLALSGGRWETRVRLSQLREQLSQYSREEQDQTLLRMQSEGRLVLYRLDDPQDTFDADRAAALYLGSDPRHLVYMKG